MWKLSGYQINKTPELPGIQILFERLVVAREKLTRAQMKLLPNPLRPATDAVRMRVRGQRVRVAQVHTPYFSADPVVLLKIDNTGLPIGILPQGHSNT